MYQIWLCSQVFYEAILNFLLVLMVYAIVKSEPYKYGLKIKIVSPFNVYPHLTHTTLDLILCENKVMMLCDYFLS